MKGELERWFVLLLLLSLKEAAPVRGGKYAFRQLPTRYPPFSSEGVDCVPRGETRHLLSRFSGPRGVATMKKLLRPLALSAILGAGGILGTNLLLADEKPAKPVDPPPVKLEEPVKPRLPGGGRVDPVKPGLVLPGGGGNPMGESKPDKDVAPVKVGDTIVKTDFAVKPKALKDQVKKWLGISRQSPARRRRVESGRRLAHRRWWSRRRREGRRPVGHRQHLLRRSLLLRVRAAPATEGRVQGEREEGPRVRHPEGRKS